MVLSDKKTLRPAVIGALLLVIALIAGQCSMSAAAGSTPVVTVTKLSLTKSGQPRVKVTTGSRAVELLIAQPGKDSSSDDLIRQKANSTKTYRLPPLKRGTRGTWEVHSYRVGGPDEYTNDRFTWSRPKRDVKRLGIKVPGSSDVYAEIHQRKGGALKVNSIRVRVVRPDGSARWLNMTHAFTSDTSNGTRVYVRSFRHGLKVDRVVARTVYGSLKNVEVKAVG